MQGLRVLSDLNLQFLLFIHQLLCLHQLSLAGILIQGKNGGLRLCKRAEQLLDPLGQGGGDECVLGFVQEVSVLVFFRKRIDDSLVSRLNLRKPLLLLPERVCLRLEEGGLHEFEGDDMADPPVLNLLVVSVLLFQHQVWIDPPCRVEALRLQNFQIDGGFGPCVVESLVGAVLVHQGNPLEPLEDPRADDGLLLVDVERLPSLDKFVLEPRGKVSECLRVPAQPLPHRIVPPDCLFDAPDRQSRIGRSVVCEQDVSQTGERVPVGL